MESPFSPWCSLQSTMPCCASLTLALTQPLRPCRLNLVGSNVSRPSLISLSCCAHALRLNRCSIQHACTTRLAGPDSQFVQSALAVVCMYTMSICTRLLSCCHADGTDGTTVATVVRICRADLPSLLLSADRPRVIIGLCSVQRQHLLHFRYPPFMSRHNCRCVQ